MTTPGSCRHELEGYIDPSYSSLQINFECLSTSEIITFGIVVSILSCSILCVILDRYWLSYHGKSQDEIEKIEKDRSESINRLVSNFHLQVKSFISLPVR